MKQLFFVLTAAAVFTSCNDTAKVAGASDNDAAKMNTEHVKEIYRALETGDVSKTDSFVAADFIDHDANPDGSDIKGWDSAKKMLSQVHNYFDGLKVEFIRDATS